jgi:hypothetical protein
MRPRPERNKHLIGSIVREAKMGMAGHVQILSSTYLAKKRLIKKQNERPRCSGRVAVFAKLSLAIVWAWRVASDAAGPRGIFFGRLALYRGTRNSFG